VSQPKSSIVRRYFPLADSFVEVRQFGAETDTFDAPASLDRAAYKRLVVSTCMPQFAGELVEQLASLFPEDPEIAADLLYDLCTEVNPGLEINRVNLMSASPTQAPEARVQQVERAESNTFWENLRKTSRDLERRLQKRVHGQDEAIGAVAQMVQRAAAGLTPENRPLGSFLLIGQTGTGKTELCRQMARELAGDHADPKANLIRIDCSEYSLAHEHSKLLGSPPGYVGHEEGGLLTRALSKTPDAIILFDEVEKAHPRLHNLMLQVLEEGCLTDGRGQRVSLERNIVMMTSNAGADEIRRANRSVGFQSGPELTRESVRDITSQALADLFSPEFLGRLDQIISFPELEESAAVAIARDQLVALALRARRRGARVSFTAAVARWVSEVGYSREYGARELRSVIQTEIEPQLAQLLLSEEIGDEDLVRGRIKDGKLHLTIER
jgi:ATP-dependent Clp protease ATP-binding subunit ClpC